MDDSQKKAKLTENLRKAMSLDTLSKSPEYIDSLLPYLKKLAQVPPIDPARYKTEDEFIFALKSANARAGAYFELINFLSQQEAMIKRIREEMEKPPKSYGI